MGILRIFFAYVVMIFHCPDSNLLPKFLHPALAVQCFYVVSGFYMQLVITKYKNAFPQDWILAFYKSRFFRIFPLYFFVLVVGYFVFMIFTTDHSFNSAIKYFFDHGKYLSILYLIFSNIFIFGQSFARMFYYDVRVEEWIFNGSLLPNLPPDIALVKIFNIIGVSWTLEVEMMFYLFVPFILLLPSTYVFLIGLTSVGIRTIMAVNDYTHHFWGYGFFPAELSIFLLGSISCRFYIFITKAASMNADLLKKIGHEKMDLIKRLALLLNKKSTLSVIYILVIIRIIYFYRYTGVGVFSGGGWGSGLYGVPYGYWGVIFYTALFLPLLFFITKNLKWDSFIGNISYPFYLIHSFVIYILTKINTDSNDIALYTLIISLFLSVLLVIFIENPVDNYRHKKFLAKKIR